MSNLKSVLVCANPDLNYIDGSSIWTQTITLAVVGTGLAKVDFLAKSLPARYDLFEPLSQHPNIRIINGTRPDSLDQKTVPQRLNAEEMAQLAIRLDKENSYDVIIVRGYDLARNLLKNTEVFKKTWIYLTDIPHSIEDYSLEQRQTITKIAYQSNRMLFQSTGLEELWHKLVPELQDDKCSIYTPVILENTTHSVPIESREKSVIYAGKFTQNWMTLEMAELWPRMLHLDAKLYMIGDKIHNDSQNYEKRMRKALEQTDGLKWLGAMPRDRVHEELSKARVGLSWRSESMNDTLEYSTKILEYGAAGCAAIVNRNPLHEKLLGDDYPLFANNQEQYLKVLETALTDDEIVKLAATRLKKVSDSHFFSKRVEEMSEWLKAIPSKVKSAQRGQYQKIRILVAGHDLKFFTPLQKKLEESEKFEFIVDHWTGHNSHNEDVSRKLLPQADIILCEWCLGNLEWYSNNRLPHQKLIGRFHLQENKLAYVANSNWQRIDHISYVSSSIRNIGQKTFGFPEEKTSSISNYISSDKFTEKKKNGDARYTIGLIGSAPMRKRLDIAVDLLEKLLERDKRFKLRVKGRHPFDYSWLAKRKEERDYYEKIFKRINSHPLLSTRVIFDPPGDDVNDWLSLVGYILSPSDFESFHMAIGEGILTGARPIIWPWEGAAEIWGDEDIVNDIEDACRVIVDEEFVSPKMPQTHHPKTVVDAWTELLQCQL